jgi:hypothetical protein
LDKSQYQIEHEYYFIDLPSLIRVKNERRAVHLLEQLQIASYPHISDKRDREKIMKSIADQLPKKAAPPPLTAEEQYQARLARMKGGG